jgi:ferredoxin-like protein FixX
MSVAAEGAPRARILDPAAIERKLALNAYNVDPARAHVRIIDPDAAIAGPIL